MTTHAPACTDLDAVPTPMPIGEEPRTRWVDVTWALPTTPQH
ncbi:hypothetical protein [Curtobacterium sp. L1-20]